MVRERENKEKERKGAFFYLFMYYPQLRLFRFLHIWCLTNEIAALRGPNKQNDMTFLHITTKNPLFSYLVGEQLLGCLEIGEAGEDLGEDGFRHFV